jgi:hypothetical protein
MINLVLMKISYILIFFFICHFTVAQDTVVFFRKNNPSLEYKLPINQFTVKVKPKAKKYFTGVILKYSDSIFTFKVRSKDKNLWSSINKTHHKFIDSIYTVNTSRKTEYDSLMFEANNRSLKILFPDQIKLSVSEIKKIKIDNHNIKSKKKLLKTIEVILFASIPLLLLPPLIGTIGPIVGMSAFGIIGTSIALELIFTSKLINLEKKWCVKKI